MRHRANSTLWLPKNKSLTFTFRIYASTFTCEKYFVKLFYYGQEIQRELKVLLEKKKNITVSGSLSFILIHSLGLNILNLNLCLTLLSMYDCLSDCRIMVSRSHQGEVMKMAEKFKPPGVVTPAGGSGYKVTRSYTHIPPINLIFISDKYY